MEVFGSPLFARFRQINVNDYRGKEALFVRILRSRNYKVIGLACRLINYLKRRNTFVFALIKD